MQALVFAPQIHTPRVNYQGRNVIAKRSILRLDTGVDWLLQVSKALQLTRLIASIDSRE